MDHLKFLQGLCTNDVNNLKQPGDSLAVSFLNNKGRIFSNAFLYLTSNESTNENKIIIEANSKLIPDLYKYLNMYKLKSKVALKLVNYSLCFETNATEITTNADSQLVVATRDPRVPGLGVRYIYSNPPTDCPRDSKSEEWLKNNNLVNGIGEGPELFNRIPLECNLDLLNYISFKKGCYIGQELTARTKFKVIDIPFILIEHRYLIYKIFRV